MMGYEGRNSLRGIWKKKEDISKDISLKRREVAGSDCWKCCDPAMKEEIQAKGFLKENEAEGIKAEEFGKKRHKFFFF